MSIRSLDTRERIGPMDRAVRPERRFETENEVFWRTLRWLVWPVLQLLSRWLGPFSGSIVKQVHRETPDLQSLADDELRHQARVLGDRLRVEGMKPRLVARMFALIREAAGRTLGMRHFDTQLAGGWVILRGLVAEMETGEGKTLTATLPAATAALAGIPVHVITVNDYLTERDATQMRPLYEFLGLSVGFVIRRLGKSQRLAAYDCDIVYGTNKEIAFDYLRDVITLDRYEHPLRLRAETLYRAQPRMSELFHRGLHFAIVDEADSVLVDESRTPLVIAGRSLDSARLRRTSSAEPSATRLFYQRALDLSRSLVRDVHYHLEEEKKHVRLSEPGETFVRDASRDWGPLWMGRVRRNEIVTVALEALFFYHRDDKYVVRAGKVLIVDEFTGRALPGRSWGRGLQQLIEVKEGLGGPGDGSEAENETLARMSYQRYFRRYLKLAGMTGTAHEVEGELWTVYGLRVRTLPTNRPLRRKAFPVRIFTTQSEKWRAVVDRAVELNAQGRPVLIGTRRILDSEEVSRALTERGITHHVLNAKQDRKEAEIVTLAGQKCAVTVATNMAGRGTDIKLGEGVNDLEGLHVIITERHEAGRIDRQLAGRCARQGDPGTYEMLVSLEDDLIRDNPPGALFRLLVSLVPQRSWLWTRLWSWAFSREQHLLEKRHARVRRDLLKHDEASGQILAFAGGAD